MATSVFRDRHEAGRTLATLLDRFREPDTVVLALPRGGVPVAYEVAQALGAPLDVLVVRRLGSPGNSELALGAIASGGVLVTNRDVLAAERVGPDVLERIARAEGRELRRREHAYRGERPLLDVTGRTVILVDDGLATGATMDVAVRTVYRMHPARVVVAVPVALEATYAGLRARVDEMVCARVPAGFAGVSAEYRDFTPSSDEEIRDMLGRAVQLPAGEQRAAATGPEVGVRSAATPLPDGVPSDDVLLDLVGDARYVLIGEATHGTSEFYAARARMTRALVELAGFDAVAVEADWPDAHRANRYIRGRGDDSDAEQALRGFQRFPMWMWRNTVVRDFVEWLREYNGRAPARTVDFYGLDLYSMRRSAAEVIGYLDRVDPAAARRARDRYACFDQHTDEQHYGYAAAFGAGDDCADAVVAQLTEMQRMSTRELRTDGHSDPDERFYAEQNARLVTAAEQYYRAMFGSRVSSWNLRDEHMFATLTALRAHLRQRSDSEPKVVVWAHNSHLGDARATELGSAGELNLGQLVRQNCPGESCILGFTTHTGTVLAADEWDGRPRVKRLRPSLPGSVENLLHRTGIERFLLRLDRDPIPALAAPQLERAIGVVYRPDNERRSHYFHARPADRFDALLHIDETSALTPLDLVAYRGPDEPGIPTSTPFEP
ncbi:erythromycin esterase [Nocardia speluncae]|uniref:Erythromycin esterase n=1 Tax=Nocardia speluncae TaxID=419477 RepID=A0A846XC27_9NOCA|nr:erythromycin esterase family protein [Nocardia speluncae]NKY32226.1 erythromycin esterase [Nocardia speluncae]